MDDAFGSPFNWCDRRCERCPISSSCPIWKRERQLEWLHTQRGEDPHDPAVVARDFEAELHLTIRTIEDIAKEEGISLDDVPLPSDEPIALAPRRLDLAGRRFFEAWCETFMEGRAPVTEDAMEAATKLAMKAGRLSSYDGPDDPVWSMDAVPNLLLVERLLPLVNEAVAQASGYLEAESLSRLEHAEAELHREFTRLLAEVQSESREGLQRLVQEGRAPSPFCVVREDLRATL